MKILVYKVYTEILTMNYNFICKNNPEHLFEVATSDFFCSLCPMEERGLLSPLDRNETNHAAANVYPVLPKAASLVRPDLTNKLNVPESSVETTSKDYEIGGIQPNKVKSVKENKESISLASAPATCIFGSQIWMTQNLSLKERKDGSSIFHAQSEKDWKLAFDKKLPAWCYPNNDPTLEIQVGLLYNFHAVNDLKNEIPEGYSIPTLQDILTLVDSSTCVPQDFLDTNSVNKDPLSVATRLPLGTFDNKSYKRTFWTQDANVFFTAHCFEIEGKQLSIKKMDKNAGFFIRCLKTEEM